MKQAIISAAMLACCFSTSLAAAEDRVVVIPLMDSTTSVSGGIPTVTSAGQVWMDRNLGALRVATKSADPDSYGTLYQWGRLGDGHEYRSSATVAKQSSSDVPGHGSFISTLLYSDWRNPPNPYLWQGESGINNPCPAGFRVPTEAEWERERTSWISQNSAGAFASPLKLALAGFRDWDGTLTVAGIGGMYWSSSVSGTNSRNLYFEKTAAGISNNGRLGGLSVRCIKD